MSTEVAERKQRSYNDEEIERGLTILALCAGNHRRASEQLEHMGHPIPGDTLYKWKVRVHATRYHEIRKRQAPKIAEAIAGQAEDFYFELVDAERDTLRKYMEGLSELKPAEAAGALRNLTTSKSLHIDKIASPLRGRPSVTVRHEHNASELVRKLSSSGVLAIDGSAEAIEDAEVVPDSLALGTETSAQRTPE